jgi:hypothetical protein
MQKRNQPISYLKMELILPQFPFLAQQHARINSLQNLAHNPLDLLRLILS